MQENHGLANHGDLRFQNKFQLIKGVDFQKKLLLFQNIFNMQVLGIWYKYNLKNKTKYQFFSEKVWSRG